MSQGIETRTDFSYRERNIISELAALAREHNDLTLADGFDIFSRRWGYAHFGRICQNDAELGRNTNDTFAALDALGITGERGYSTQNPEMKLRDYLVLVPEEMLPDDYVF